MEPPIYLDQLFQDCAQENNVLVKKSIFPDSSASSASNLNTLLDTLLGLPRQRNFPELELVVLYNCISIKINTCDLDRDLLSDLEGKCLAVLNRINDEHVSSVERAFNHLFSRTYYDDLSSLASMIFCLLGVGYLVTGEKCLNSYADILRKLLEQAASASETPTSSLAFTLTNFQTLCANGNNQRRAWSSQLAFFIDFLLGIRNNITPNSTFHKVTNTELAPYGSLIVAYLAMLRDDTLTALKEFNSLRLDKEMPPELQAQVFNYSAYCSSMLGKHDHAIRLYKEEVELSRYSGSVIFNISLQHRLVGEHEKELAALEDLGSSAKAYTSASTPIAQSIEIQPHNVKLFQGCPHELNFFQCLSLQATRLCELAKCDQALEKFRILLRHLEENKGIVKGCSSVDISEVYVKAVLCATHSGKFGESVSLVKKFEQFISSGNQDSTSQASLASDIENIVGPQEMLIQSQSIFPYDGGDADNDGLNNPGTLTNMARVLLLKAEIEAITGDIQSSIQFIDNAISLIEGSKSDNNLLHVSKRQKIETVDNSEDDTSIGSDFQLLAGAYATKAMAYASMRQYPEANIYSKKAVDICPQDNTFAYNHALLLFCIGEEKKAIEYWGKYRNIKLPANQKDCLTLLENIQSVLQNECPNAVYDISKQSTSVREFTVTKTQLAMLDIYTLQKYKT